MQAPEESSPKANERSRCSGSQEPRSNCILARHDCRESCHGLNVTVRISRVQFSIEGIQSLCPLSPLLAIVPRAEPLLRVSFRRYCHNTCCVQMRRDVSCFFKSSSMISLLPSMNSLRFPPVKGQNPLKL